MKNKKLAILTSVILIFSIISCSDTTKSSMSASSAKSIDSLEDQNDTNKPDEYSPKLLDSNSTKEKFKTYDSSVPLIENTIGIPVLYYHSVNESEENEVIISPEKLKMQLQYIKNQGYQTLTIDQVNDYILNNSKIPEKSILITFDDGYADNYTCAFPILKELNMTATIFCITNGMDGSYYMSPENAKEMHDYGISIQSHTLTHAHLNTLSYEDQLKELKDSKKYLEDFLGTEVISIAFPFGDYNSNTIKASKEAGYKLAFTTNQGLSNKKTNSLELNRIYVSSKYDMETFKSLLTKYNK